MKTQRISLLIFLAISALFIWHNVQSQAQNIDIQGADAVNELIPAASSTLNGLIANVAPRFLVEHANEMKFYAIAPAPSGLQALIGQVADRFVIQYANANVVKLFAFPASLLGDTFPPQISGLTASGKGQIRWNTDEFADGEVGYGTQPGNYPNIVHDPLFYKQHLVTLDGLIPGTTYFYKVVSTDRSGNTVESAEQMFIASSQLFLPFIKK